MSLKYYTTLFILLTSSIHAMDLEQTTIIKTCTEKFQKIAPLIDFERFSQEDQSTLKILPKEIFTHLINFLPLSDAQTLSQTSHSFRNFFTPIRLKFMFDALPFIQHPSHFKITLKEYGKNNTFLSLKIIDRIYAPLFSSELKENHDTEKCIKFFLKNYRADTLNKRFNNFEEFKEIMENLSIFEYLIRYGWQRSYYPHLIFSSFQMRPIIKRLAKIYNFKLNKSALNALKSSWLYSTIIPFLTGNLIFTLAYVYFFTLPSLDYRPKFHQKKRHL